MSVKIERRLRSRKTYNNDETPSNISKLIKSNNRHSSVSSITSFDSEILTTALKLDISSEKKVYKKKIRSTQEFNQVDSNFTSQGSSVLTKTKIKKTKKKTNAYNLPRISNDEVVWKKRVTRKSRTHSNMEAPEDINFENQSKQVLKIKQSKNGGRDEDVNSQTELYKQSKENIESDLSFEEYQSANSTISYSQKDSDDEVFIQHKKKTKKRKSTGSTIEELKLNTVEKYAKRIKKLLSDSLVISSKSNDASNSSNLATPLTDKKLVKITPVKKSNKKLKGNGTTSEVDEISIREALPGCDNDQNETKKLSISTRLSHKISSTPHPKKKLSANRLSNNLWEKQHSLGKTTPSNTSFSNCFSPVADNLNKKYTASSKSSSTLSVNVNFDMDFESDDVFDDTYEKPFKKTNIDRQEYVKDDLSFNDNVSKKIRKSVRFQSPERTIRRETIILSKLPTDNTIATLEQDKSVNDCSTHSFLEGSLSLTGSCKDNNETFQITSPKVINLLNSFQDMSQNQDLFNDSGKEQNTSHCEKNVSQQSMDNGTKRKCSIELLSSATKTCRKTKNKEKEDIKFKNSIIDLTTPLPIKKIDAHEKLNNVPVKLRRQSTFSIEDEIFKSSLLDNEVTQIGETKQSKTDSESMPKLVRTSTFTKEDEITEQVQDVPADLNNSLLQSSSPYSKPLDSSNVNRRKRWDKSRASVSFLNDSLDIGNLSAPWLENDLSKNLDNSKAHVQKHNSEARCSPKINDSNSSIKIRSVPSKTSTPLPINKTSLLRQALLKDNGYITKIGNKSHNGHDEKPKFVRTKIPNFALIHQRALDKLENIKEMSERKAARAKLLLSGHKPTSENNPKMSTKRKELKFSPTSAKSSLNECKSNNKSLSKLNISVTKVNNISPSMSNLKVANKENRLSPLKKKKEAIKAKLQIPKSKLPNAVTLENKGFTRFGFKVNSNGAKKSTKDEQVKAITNKTKIMKNTVENRRNVIQGVRSNRRFELLMNMRMK